MKKTKIDKICYTISIILVIAFIIRVIVDYYNRSSLITVSFNFVLKLRIIEFILPSIIFFIIATILKKKFNNKTN